MLKLHRKNWGKGTQIHDNRVNQTDYSIYIDPAREDLSFNQNVQVRESDSGKLIKMAFKADGIHLIDNSTKL